MKRKILVVENDMDILGIIKYVLESEGFTVLTMTAPQSIQTIVTAKPDLMLIDEWFADEPESRLCHQIKQFGKLKHVPMIIMSTAHKIETIMKECGADAFIRKPFNITDIIDAINEHLSGKN